MRRHNDEEIYLWKLLSRRGDRWGISWWRWQGQGELRVKCGGRR